MYILTDRYGLRCKNVLVIDPDLDEVFPMAKDNDTILWIGETDEESENLLLD